MKKLMHKMLSVAVMASMITTLVACGGYSATTTTSTSSTNKTAVSNDLNSMSLEDIIAKAKEEGEVNSVGMPDTWANWKGTWEDLEEVYGLKHSDVDMSSAEEIAMFKAEKNNATKDIGDVGEAFGPIAEEEGVTLAYKTSYWDDIPDWAKDDDGDWIIGYYGTISVMSNMNKLDVAPTSFQDILEGDYMVNVGDVTTAAQAQSTLLAATRAFGGDESNLQPGLNFFKSIAEQGRLDKGEGSLARLEKGEIDCIFLWDYNAMNYRDQLKVNNPDSNYEINIPSEASVQSGYATILNAYSKRPHAAALAREYILSDEGQINLAIGYATPIRSSVELPEEVLAKRIPDEQYANAAPIEDYESWQNSATQLGILWQEEVIAYS